MARPALELAALFRQHGAAYRARHRLGREQLRAMRAIEVCRTAALGGHVDQCGHCDHVRVSYNSCRNRHCPKCQSLARAQWLEDRKAELLPVPYFHVVFTLPKQVAAIVFQNPAAAYGILFRAASETLLTIARDRRHLGAEIGFFAVLHSWGQNLLYHPHLHCVVPGGGLSVDEPRWVACKPGFFLPVKVLSRLFRKLFLRSLDRAFAKGELRLSGELARLTSQAAWGAYVGALGKIDWVVYAKPPFGGPRQVIEYLGRYTHRVAISNQRLLRIEGDAVTFQWKDYRHKHKNKSRLLTLSAEEFLRRFLMHVLPPGFQRIRHFGFLANCCRKYKLPVLRNLLSSPITQLLPEPGQCRQLLEEIRTRYLAPRCPRCGIGVLCPIQILPSYRWPAKPPEDTS